MIGDYVYFTNLSGLIGSAFLFLVGILLIFELLHSKATGDDLSKIGHNQRHPLAKKSGFLLVIWLCFSGGIFASCLGDLKDMALHHAQLSDLPAKAVVSIKIADRNFTEKSKIALFVDALKDVQYFTLNHGGISEEGLPCQILLNSGSSYSFIVLRDLRRDGVIIDFRNPSDGQFGKSDHCLLFSLKLQTVLNDAGIQLPNR